jgi:hypothetical protein
MTESPTSPTPTTPPAGSSDGESGTTTEWPVLPTPAPAEGGSESAAAEAVAVEPVPAEPAPEPASAEPVPTPAQTSLAAPRGLTYAVDIVFCIDVTGSMNPIIDAVKANALGFYDDVQTNLTAKGKNVAQLRVRVVAFRDFVADGDAALDESPFFSLPTERNAFSEFVNGLTAQGGGDAPESGLEAVSLAINSPWTRTGDRRRQVIVVWTDQPAHPLQPSVLPPDLASRVPADFSALTDAWEDEQGLMGSSSKRLILFAPDGPGWSDISAVWENVVHNPSQAGGGLSEVDYGTIIDSIGNSV